MDREDEYDATDRDLGDWEQIEDEGSLSTSDTLDDDAVEDALDAGIVPADKWSGANRFGTTPEEEREGESLDARLAEEEPDIALDDGEGDDDDDEDELTRRGYEVDPRAGRLFAEDEGLGPGRGNGRGGVRRRYRRRWSERRGSGRPPESTIRTARATVRCAELWPSPARRAASGERLRLCAHQCVQRRRHAAHGWSAWGRRHVCDPVTMDPRTRGASRNGGRCDAVADVWLRSFASALPTVRRAHSDDEVRSWIRDVVVPGRETWVATVDGAVVAMMVLDAGRDGADSERGAGTGEIDQLYVDPSAQGHGLGSRLVDVAKRRYPVGLELWTFQVNVTAQRFYERHGFVAIDRTDGSGNEEREPDIRYRWRAGA